MAQVELTVSPRRIGLTVAPRAITMRVGRSVDSNYVHNQAVASTSWVIVHNMGKYPSVTVVDSAGTQVISQVVYDSDTQITVTHSYSFSGKAYLN